MTYKTRNFLDTMAAISGPSANLVAPVSRYDVDMSSLVPRIVAAQRRVGIPDAETIERLKRTPIKTKDDLKNAYADVQFIEGSRPMLVIEVCYSPNSPEAMRNYFEAACRFRDDEDPELKVFIGTIQNSSRFDFMIKNGYLPDAVVSTNMAPLRDEHIRDMCREYEIVLGPNVGFDLDKLTECLGAQVTKDGIIIAGPAIQKIFPAGAVDMVEYLSGVSTTYPGASPMPTGKVSELTARNLIRYGAALVGASAPAKLGDIVQAAHDDTIGRQGPSAWDGLVRRGSILVTEAEIGRQLRQEDKAKGRSDSQKWYAMLEELTRELTV